MAKATAKPVARKPGQPRLAAEPKPAPAAKASRIEIIECEQGSEEWHKHRCGLITASNFSKVMAQGEGKVRMRYLRDLAGETLSGIPAETYEGPAMRRGKEMEAEARAQYARMNFVEVQQVGLVKNHGLLKYAGPIGCSPDGLIGDKGGLECKSMIPALLIERIDMGSTFPPAHKAQVQGNLWVTEREWWDVKLFYPGMPPFVVKAYRDETYIKNMSDEVERFAYDLKQLVKRLRDMGGGR